MKKTLISILVITIIALGALILVKDRIIKDVLVKQIKSATGLEVELESIKVGLLTANVDVTGLKIHNPSGFPEKIMLNIPKIYINYDLFGFFSRKVHLKKLLIEIKDVNIAKSADKKLNVYSLAVLGGRSLQASPVQAIINNFVSLEKKEEKPKGERPRAQKPQITIDDLQLKIGRVAYKDYAEESGAMDIALNLNIDETFKNVTDPNTVASTLMFKLLGNVGMDALNKYGAQAAREEAAKPVEAEAEPQPAQPAAAGEVSPQN